jgi:hypothetical protein
MGLMCKKCLGNHSRMGKLPEAMRDSSIIGHVPRRGVYKINNMNIEDQIKQDKV